MLIVQNNIWMRFLLLGAFSFILFNFSCKKRVDYLQEAEFIYINKTGKSIQLPTRLEGTIVIETDGRYIRKTSGDGPKTIQPDTYNLNIYTYFVMNNIGEVFTKLGDKCFKSTVNSEHSIINTNSYIVEKVSNSYYKFTYTFTEADYNRAVACP